MSAWLGKLPAVTEQTVRLIVDPEMRAEVTGLLRDIQKTLVDVTSALNDAMASMSLCDGRHPDGQPCILAWHQGPHRGPSGEEWLDA